MVLRSPRLSTRKIASRVGLSHMQVWRTLHEEDLYPYHDQRVQHLELVYETKVDSRAALRCHIFAAADHICNHSDNIASAT